MAEEIEARAKELGWAPKEQFKGDPERWVDAVTYVQRGEELVPLLKATTRKQGEKITQLETKLTKAEAALATATDAISALTEATSKANLDKVRDSKKEIKAALVKARTDGDVEQEVELHDKLSEVNEAIKASETAAGTTKASKTASGEPAPKEDLTQNPEWIAWTTDNEWWGIDKRKTALAMGVAQELREKGDTSQGKAFWDKVAKETNETLGVKPNTMRDIPSKVEGDTRGSAGGNGRGRSYEDLPKEAKDACEVFAERVVGKGRAFADVASWRKHYTAEYFKE